MYQQLKNTGAEVPALFTAEHDVNPLCGHHLGQRCDGCSTCMVCNVCYCEEMRENNREDARVERAYRDHEEHLDADDPECYLCRSRAIESNGYTTCPQCGGALPNGLHDWFAHTPPYCRGDIRRQPAGIDWSYLIGQDVELVGSSYSVHGRILEQEPPDIADLWPLLRFQRTDPGYEHEVLEPGVAIREWAEVRPAPPAPTVVHAQVDTIWQVTTDVRAPWCDDDCRRHQHTYRARCRCGAMFTDDSRIGAATLLRLHLDNPEQKGPADPAAVVRAFMREADGGAGDDDSQAGGA